MASTTAFHQVHAPMRARTVTLNWQERVRRGKGGDLDERRGAMERDENTGKRGREGRGRDRGIPRAVVIDSGVYGRIV